MAPRKVTCVQHKEKWTKVDPCSTPEEMAWQRRNGALNAYTNAASMQVARYPPYKVVKPQVKQF